MACSFVDEGQHRDHPFRPNLGDGCVRRHTHHLTTSTSHPSQKNKHTQVITDKSQRQLVRELDASLPRYVLLDKIRFSQLIMNLTSNAAKVRKSEASG